MDSNDLESARNEAKFLQRLNHPNVIHIIDMFEDDENIIIVLPLFDKSLFDYLRKLGKPVDENEARRIFNLIASGVHHCHQNGIIHCDLKPANILVNLDENQNIVDVCITDFGLSLEADKLKESVGRRGSLPYMAPELLDIGKSFDAQIDSWALGVILHELLTNQKPYVNGRTF